MGLRLDPLTLRDLFRFVLDAAREGRKVTISHLNVHAVNLARNDPEVRRAINRSDRVFCDGMGVRIAARLSGLNVPERMTAPDFIDALCREVGPRGVFLLGNKPEVLERGLRRLRDASPQARIDGHHGYFDRQGPENDRVLDRIREFAPAVVLVGFGMPIQEKWIYDNRSRIEAPVVIPVGAMLDWVTGFSRRGPRWLTDRGGEWLARLGTQPGHVGRRYVLGNPLFLWRWHGWLLDGRRSRAV